MEPIEEGIKKQLENVVNAWCPKVFNHESFETRMMRALLNVSAYMSDCALIKNGSPRTGMTYPIDLPHHKHKSNLTGDKQ